MLGKGFDSKDKRKKKMDLNVLVWDDCIRPIRALVFVLVQREARMQADNEMSGAGRVASGEGGRPPTVIIIIISKWAKPPAGSQQEQNYFYLH